MGFARQREPNCRGRSILHRPQRQSAEESAAKNSGFSALPVAC
ncbi:hypothetical protein [Geobacillus sp. BMUD]|nr:hypothetical protein [Geobacillus sp. BMUD]